MVPKRAEKGHGRNARQEGKGNNVGSDVRISGRYFEILLKKSEEFLISVTQTDFWCC